MGGDGIRMHGKVLHSLQRNAMAGIGVAAQTTAGNPKGTLQDGKPAHERGPTT